MLPTVYGEFGIVAEPEIKFTDKASAWVKLRCVAKDRVRQANGSWGDGDPLFIDVLVFQGAENIYESVMKGDSVMVMGKLKQRNWEKDGQKHSSIQIYADSIGPSTRWAPARTQRVIEDGGNPSIVKEMLGATDITEPPF